MKTITTDSTRITLRPATAKDRETVYQLRHEVYADELGQHAMRPEGRIQDPLDEFNTYLVAVTRGKIAGFISITPPVFGRYSLDKYVTRTECPFAFDEGVYEVRLLTVLKPQRGQALASLLMYAAFRWVETRGGTRIIGMGRREVLELYRKLGMQTHDREIHSGAVTYELMSAEVSRLRERADTYARLLNRFEWVIDWQFEFPFHRPAECFHGGAFFTAIGPEFNRLERRHEIINADVLDAWFPPSPRVLAALRGNLDWLLQTSPPTGCEGMTQVIARMRGVPKECVLPAAGSSDLIFLALRHWLKPDSRVLLLDPTYGEYAHVLEHVIRCRVERFALAREQGYAVDLERLEQVLARRFDLLILVNPNSPTGRHVPRAALERLLSRIPQCTRVWIDETYVDYVGTGHSLESLAAAQANIVVCKSMSKVYALSGARAAYLCGAPEVIAELRAITPPWAVSLPAQVAAVTALQDPEYYTARYAETRQLREALTAELSCWDGWEVVPGSANFLLCHLPVWGPDAGTVVARCRARGLFLRDAGAMGTRLGRHALRLAVKDAATNRRMLAILAEETSGAPNRHGRVIVNSAIDRTVMVEAP